MSDIGRPFLWVPCYTGAMKKPPLIAWLLVSAVGLTSALLGSGCSKMSGGASVEPKTDEEKTIYTWGAMLGRNVKAVGLSERELDMLKAGITDAASKKKLAVDLEKFEPQIGPMMRKRAEARGEAEKGKSAGVLEAAGKEAGAEKLPSGVIVATTRAGTGAQPTATDQVKVHYEGRLADGEVFDSSRKRGEPAVMPLDRVIPCWREGVAKMKVGGTAKITCPSDTAYGPMGQSPVIPGNAVLTFDVELLDIVKAPPAPGGLSVPPPPPPAAGTKAPH